MFEVVKLYRNLLCSLGKEQTDVTYLSPKCSNEGHANTITYLESFGVSLEKDNERSSKDSTDYAFEWYLFTSVLLNKKHQGKKYNHQPQRDSHGLSHKAFEWCDLQRRASWQKPTPAKVFLERPVSP